MQLQEAGRALAPTSWKALAIGALAIGWLAVRQGKVGRLEIEDLVVGRLTIRELIVEREHAEA